MPPEDEARPCRRNGETAQSAQRNQLFPTRLIIGRTACITWERSMKPPMVRVMDAADEDSAVAIIVLAFAADPMARWTWPHARQYLEAIPRMTRASEAKPV